MLACILIVSWILTPVLLIMLYRKSLRLQRHLTELSERLVVQHRQQQVERLKFDSDRRRPGRRR
ncbi:MAG: hypothetical protein FJZ47_07715 [Candidatus Tectomicrobia bacterium]|uniref:Uncharacterized protein n=1 Tax=Tectimicrobiota bacterium TaxID=2528274 RepID=A0A937VYT7_UNCTE|nr:hypothetical protein [Candidatus Tectomicrobia bacterium]